jgi:uncharacterized protein YkwD
MELYIWILIPAVAFIIYLVIAGKIRYDANNQKTLPTGLYKLVSIIYPEGSRKALIARYVNEKRDDLNLPALKTDQFLDKMAQRRCEEIDINNELSHRGVADEFVELKERGSHGSAELLAGGYGTAKGVVNGWMNSEGHYKAMVSYKYDAFAIHSKWDESEKRWIDVLLMIDIYKDLT